MSELIDEMLTEEVSQVCTVPGCNATNDLHICIPKVVEMLEKSDIFNAMVNKKVEVIDPTPEQMKTIVETFLKENPTMIKDFCSYCEECNYDFNGSEKEIKELVSQLSSRNYRIAKLEHNNQKLSMINSKLESEQEKLYAKGFDAAYVQYKTEITKGIKFDELEKSLTIQFHTKVQELEKQNSELKEMLNNL